MLFTQVIWIDLFSKIYLYCSYPTLILKILDLKYTSFLYSYIWIVQLLNGKSFASLSGNFISLLILSVFL